MLDDMRITEEDIRFMNMAAELAEKNIDNGGGPFGAVIVRDGVVVATGVNRVTIDNDPTAHAEVNAIRSACSKEHTFNLAGCIVYTSCEPCPMCLGAIYWAHIDKIYYGATQYDAAEVGFDDSFIYRELELKSEKRNKPIENILHNEALAPFVAWQEKDDKIEY